MSSDVLSPKEDSRRFDVELLVVHPFMSADEISRELQLEAHFSHNVGEPRVTPKGTSLPGVYQDTRWRHTVRHTLQDQWFANHAKQFIESLKPHREVLARFRADGGRTMLILQFLNDDYFGDEIRCATLATMIDLGLDFGIECFPLAASPENQGGAQRFDGRPGESRDP
jgi:hypothetical protein